ncbi:hypothetical protein PCI56_13510 [Plesiomonas shigelloides subsp. oncorhynchi]|nr:hypothetical protein [Plesiomonas shigelloides]
MDDKLPDATPREVQLIKQSAEALFEQQEAIKASNKAKQEGIPGYRKAQPKKRRRKLSGSARSP